MTITRQKALDTIRVEFAKHGMPTRTSTRMYVEHRIGFAAYTDARLAGLEIFNAEHEAEVV